MIRGTFVPYCSLTKPPTGLGSNGPSSSRQVPDSRLTPPLSLKCWRNPHSLPPALHLSQTRHRAASAYVIRPRRKSRENVGNGTRLVPGVKTTGAPFLASPSPNSSVNLCTLPSPCLPGARSFDLPVPAFGRKTRQLHMRGSVLPLDSLRGAAVSPAQAGRACYLQGVGSSLHPP